MTSEIFIEWLDKLNSKFKSENRKILLYLDNFSGHYRKDKVEHNYSNIKIRFYPANCTSIIQPMDDAFEDVTSRAKKQTTITDFFTK